MVTSIYLFKFDLANSRRSASLSKEFIPTSFWAIFITVIPSHAANASTANAEEPELAPTAGVTRVDPFLFLGSTGALLGTVPRLGSMFSPSSGSVATREAASWRNFDSNLLAPKELN